MTVDICIPPPTFGPVGPYRMILTDDPSTDIVSPPWTPTWPWVAAGMTGGGAAICAALGLWLWTSGWSCRRDDTEPRRSLIVTLAGLGLGAGVVAALTVVAIPKGSSVRYTVSRLAGLTRVRLTDADVLWWLLPPAGAVIGVGAGILLTRYHRRLTRISRDPSD